MIYHFLHSCNVNFKWNSTDRHDHVPKFLSKTKFRWKRKRFLSTQRTEFISNNRWIFQIMKYLLKSQWIRIMTNSKRNFFRLSREKNERTDKFLNNKWKECKDIVQDWIDRYKFEQLDKIQILYSFEILNHWRLAERRERKSFLLDQTNRIHFVNRFDFQRYRRFQS